MMDYLLIYLWLKLDTLATMFSVIAWAGVIGACFIPILFAAADDLDWECDFKKWGKRYATVVCLSFVCWIVLPSTKEVALIVGGKLAIDASKGDTAKAVLGRIEREALKFIEPDKAKK